tara:strand:- start:432 stop:857 length:426 start_codon:yes stop_codon:yes gene_type:complete
MKKLLILIPFMFLAFNSFTQDIKYGEGLFEANFIVDMMYSDDLKNYKLTASGEAGPYGRAYLSYEFTSLLNVDGQGEFTGTAWAQNGEQLESAILRGIYRRKGNIFKLYTLDNLSNGKFILATGELDMVKKTLNFKASYVE